MDTPALSVDMRNIHKRFGGVIALSGVKLQVERGEVHALVGENGAGKTTLIKILGGVQHMDEGEIYIDNKPVTIASPRDGIKQGVSIIYQELVLAQDLSVAENIYLDIIESKHKLVNWKLLYKNARELLDRLGFSDINEKATVSELTVAYQQIVEIAKAVTKDMKILVLDEPTSLLSTNEVQRLFAVIRTLKSQGVSVLYISHRLGEVFEIADRITVLKDGEYVDTVPAVGLTEMELVRMMIDRDIKGYFPERNAEIGEVAFEVSGISRGRRVKDVSFHVRFGEVLGLAGLVGAGRTETIRAIIGADKRERGAVFIDGRETRIKTPTDSFKNGVGFLSEDRKSEGVILEMPIRCNVTISCLKRYLNKLGFIRKKKETTDVEDLAQKLRIKTPSIELAAMNLSGGNQQKVAIAKLLASGCRVFLFDEPTRGVDVGAKREIYTLMNNLAEAGNAIVMVSSETAEIIGMCDRIVVMREGFVTGTLEKPDFSEDTIISYAMGVTKT